MTQKEQDQAWAKLILGYAKEMWAHDGWDIIYETMSVADIVEKFESAREYDPIDTYQQAFDHIDWLRNLWEGQRSEVQSSAW